MTDLAAGQELLHKLGAVHPLVLGEPTRLRGDTPAWVSHIPFAFWLVTALRPKCLVELGTHTGGSFSAFCQAVKTLGLDTRAYAVDTWQGDDHAGFYGDIIFNDVSAFTREQYGAFSTLLRMTFDEALGSFEDGSVDLLHIDGLHTYDAVKHDFESWLPKLAPRAIVLFHDTQVREGSFEVWRLFAELASTYPSFEFLHGHGLGVICISNDVPRPLDLLLLPPGQTLDAEVDDAIQTFFATLGNNWVQRGLSEERLKEQIQLLQARLDQASEVRHSPQDVRHSPQGTGGIWQPLRKKFGLGGANSRD